LFNLNSFDVILENTFLDAYKINILHNGNKVKVCAKVSFKLVKLKMNYSFALAKVKINLASLTKELKSPSFVVLMSLKVSKGRLQL
jgi:hypothetical protein